MPDPKYGFNKFFWAWNSKTLIVLTKKHTGFHRDVCINLWETTGEMESKVQIIILAGLMANILACPKVHSKRDQSWVFFGRNDAKAETPVLWPPHAESWLIGKDSDAGRDWGQEEKGTTEDEMAGWQLWLDGLEFEWIPGVGDGQGGLACCDSWGCKELDTTEQLNWTEDYH